MAKAPFSNVRKGKNNKSNLRRVTKQELGIDDNHFTNVQLISLWKSAIDFSVDVKWYYFMLLYLERMGWYYTHEGFIGLCKKNGVDISLATIKKYSKQLQQKGYLRKQKVRTIKTKTGAKPVMEYTLYEYPELLVFDDSTITDTKNIDINF